jgi:membrane associated rhomboid family serine protease
MTEPTIQKITAPLGTPEFQEQCEQQSRDAFDAAFRLWFIRYPASLLCLVGLVGGVVEIFISPEDRFHLIALLLCWIPVSAYVFASTAHSRIIRYFAYKFKKEPDVVFRSRSFRTSIVFCSLIGLIGIVMLFFSHEGDTPLKNPAQFYLGIGISLGGLISSIQASKMSK